MKKRLKLKKNLDRSIARLKKELESLKQHERLLTKKKRLLSIENKELARLNARLKKLILKDYHTGLYNRRFLEDAVEKELSYSRRHNQSFSVMMMDLDYFKSINDAYGHEMGDIVLKQFARFIKSMLRRHDTVIRFGGEEFIIIAPRTDRATSLLLGRRIIEEVSEHSFGTKKNAIKLKLSMGIASYPEDGLIMDGMCLVYLADKVLRRVKEFGGSDIATTAKLEKAECGALAESEAEVRTLKRKVERLARRANQCVVEAVFAFAKTIGMKDRYTERRVENGVLYAEAVAKALGLPKTKIELVRKAAILHDLGKVGIDEDILRKKAKLTAQEYDMIKTHPKIGADIIKPIKFLSDLVPYIHHHHERWDGKGYPSGLKGEDIPIGARILALIDVYQSLTSNRPYRKAYSKEEALGIIEKESGKAYDPRVTETFLKVMKREE